MSYYVLKPNEDKIEVLVLGPNNRCYFLLLLESSLAYQETPPTLLRS